MADLFKCDKCGVLGPSGSKRGRMIVQELRDGQAHISYYNRKAEVCEKCFWELQRLMNNAVTAPTLADSMKIVTVNVIDTDKE